MVPYGFATLTYIDFRNCYVRQVAQLLSQQRTFYSGASLSTQNSFQLKRLLKISIMPCEIRSLPAVAAQSLFPYFSTRLLTLSRASAPPVERLFPHDSCTNLSNHFRRSTLVPGRIGHTSSATKTLHATTLHANNCERLYIGRLPDRHRALCLVPQEVRSTPNMT